MDWLERLQEPKYWLLGIVAAIATIHLTLIDRTSNEELFAISGLFWMVAGLLIWEKRDELNLESQVPASAAGWGILAVLLLLSASLPTSNMFLCGFPLFALLATALLASGAGGLRQYWKELVIFTLLAAYPVIEIVLQSFDLPTLTAKAANMMLWYTGFDVKRQGVFLDLPGRGRVEVYAACSGLHSIMQMISVSVLFLLMFPLKKRWQGVACVVVAIALGFLVNAARVCLMALLVGTPNFQFWHDGQGSLVFSVISVSLFGAFCWFAFLRNPKPLPTLGDS